MYEVQTPLILFVYNRENTTRQLLDALSHVKASKIYVFADGPKKEIFQDYDQCAKVRALIDQFSKRSSIKKFYSDINRGCEKQIPSGISEVLSHEKRCIVLEDDCIPESSFFRYCDELLDYYENDTRIMTISGTNIQVKKRTSDSYYFSKFTHSWGWATWKRAWQHYDHNMNKWQELKTTNWLREHFTRELSIKIWTNIFDRVVAEQMNAWDYRWLYSMWLKRGYTIIPSVNLVKHIGFGSESTHFRNTTQKNEMKTRQIEFPLRHPKVVSCHALADEFTQRIIHENRKSLLSKIAHFMKLQSLYLRMQP